MDPDADLSPPGLARLISDFLEALDLSDVTLVGSDMGGALAQVLISRHPERVGGLILTNCDAYEHFPPPLGLPLKWGAFVPGFVTVLAQALRLPPVGRLLYALLARRKPGRSVLKSYFAPLIRDAGVRRDAAKAMRGLSKRWTLEAARKFSEFRGPVLIVWGEDDLVFFGRDAERLRRDFTDARLEWVAGSRAFVCEDQPERLVGLISAFQDRRRAASRRARPA